MRYKIKSALFVLINLLMLSTNLFGQIRYINKITECSDGIFGLVGVLGITMSPDKKNIYVTSEFSMSVFSYDTNNGDLKFIKTYMDNDDGFNGLNGANCVVVSKDNKNVYISSASENCVTICKRDLMTGLLSLKKIIYTNASQNLQLTGAHTMVLSDDDRFLYLTTFGNDNVSVFARDSSTGNLNWLQTTNASGFAHPKGIILSNDNNYIYITLSTANTIYVFQRNATTGLLSYVQTVEEGINGVTGIYQVGVLAVSHDNNFLYAAGSSTLAVFSRNISTGFLTYITCYRDNVGGVDGLLGNYSITIPHDDKSVYTVSNRDSSLTTFVRDTFTGQLTYLNSQRINGEWIGSGLKSTTSMISMSNNELAVTCYWGLSIKTYHRNPATGQLSFHTSYTYGQDATISGLSGAKNSAVSPDNNNVYVASYEGISIYSRSDSFGRLTYKGVIKESTSLNGLTGAKSLFVTPDNKFVYVASQDDDAIVIFRRNIKNNMLDYVQTIFDKQNGVVGLNGATAITMSPDMSFIYVGSTLDDGITSFVYDSSNGSLVFVEHFDLLKTLGYNIPVDKIKITNDGNYLLALSINDGLYLFKRNTSNGRVSYLSKCKNINLGNGTIYGLNSFDISFDNKNLYATYGRDDYILNFAINYSTNSLEVIEGLNSDLNHLEMIRNPNIISVSNDDRYIYVTSLDSSTVTIFHRNLTDGKLSLVKAFKEREKDSFEGLDGISSISFSPDSKNVYFTSDIESGISAYRISAFLGNDIIACKDDTVELNPGNWFSTYKWSTGESTKTLKVTNDGNYSVKVTDEMGFIEYDTIVVHFNSKPVFTLGADTVICTNNSVVLGKGLDFTSYLWNTNKKTSTISVSKSGKYSVIVTDSNGCKNSDTINIGNYSLPDVYLGPDTGICDNKMFFLKVKANYVSYLWNTGYTSNIIQVTKQGKYSVSVTDSNNCKNADTINIVINQSPKIDLGSDDTIHINQSLILAGQYSYPDYLWSTGETTQSIKIDSSSFSADSVLIWVILTLSNKCTASDTITIYLDSTISSISDFKNSSLIKVYPNPFNDIITLECYENYQQINIYNLDGKCLYNKQLKQGIHTLKTGFLNKGIYLFEIITTQDTILKKIIKID